MKARMKECYAPVPAILHSACSAIMGSILDARATGRYPASRATISRTGETVMIDGQIMR